MINLFTAVLNMSITASYVALAVIVMRMLLIKNAQNFLLCTMAAGVGKACLPL